MFKTIAMTMAVAALSFSALSVASADPMMRASMREHMMMKRHHMMERHHMMMRRHMMHRDM